MREGNSPDALNAAFFGVPYTDSSKVKSLASVTGRIGYAWDQVPGLRQGRHRLGARQLRHRPRCCRLPSASASETRSGWTVGIGGEYAFTGNLSAFIEYDWYSFGTEPSLFLTPAGVAFDYINIKDNKSVLKIGVNWKFGKGPVVASY